MRLAAAIVFLLVLLVGDRADGSIAVAGGYIVAGPAQAGTAVVWADRPSRTSGTVTLRRLEADGSAEVEMVRYDCGSELDLAASASYAALTGCGNQIQVAGLDVPDPLPVSCTGPMDILGTELIAGSCSGSTSALTLFSLPTGRRTQLPAQLGSGRTLLQVRMAGERFATLTTGGFATATPTPTPTASPSASPTPSPTATVTRTPTPTPTAVPNATPRHVSIYDRSGTTPQLDQSIVTLTGADLLGPPSLRLAVEQDDGGTVLVGSGPAGSNTMRFAWASLTDPSLTEVPGEFVRTAGRTTLAGGLFATATFSDEDTDGLPRQITVHALDGQERAQFRATAQSDSVERGVPFDGTRISWTSGFVIVANEVLADLLPEATRPRVRITSPAGTKRARKVLFVRGTARDPDGRVAEVRVGLTRVGDCRPLTHVGRLGPSRFPGGRCRPKARFVAQGGEAWTFPLKRRLPRGTYAIRAIVRDDTGQRGFDKRRVRIR